MNFPDTTPELGATGLLGAMDLGGMMAALGIELPDPDDPTLVDLDEQLGLIVEKLDWIAGALIAVLAMVPAKFTPDLPAYPTD